MSYTARQRQASLVAMATANKHLSREQIEKWSAPCIWPGSLRSRCAATSPPLFLAFPEASPPSSRPVSLLADWQGPTALAPPPDTVPGLRPDKHQNTCSKVSLWGLQPVMTSLLRTHTHLDRRRPGSVRARDHAPSGFGPAQFLLWHDAVSFLLWETLKHNSASWRLIVYYIIDHFII